MGTKTQTADTVRKIMCFSLSQTSTPGAAVRRVVLCCCAVLCCGVLCRDVLCVAMGRKGRVLLCNRPGTVWHQRPQQQTHERSTSSRELRIRPAHPCRAKRSLIPSRPERKHVHSTFSAPHDQSTRAPLPLQCCSAREQLPQTERARVFRSPGPVHG